MEDTKAREFFEGELAKTRGGRIRAESVGSQPRTSQNTSLRSEGNSLSRFRSTRTRIHFLTRDTLLF